MSRGGLRSAPTAAGRLSHRSRVRPAGECAAIDVPAGQVFVRDLATKTTTLVTATRDRPESGQPAGGALGAALSADGTTVAWTGGNAAAQTRFLGGENTDPTFVYYLWRRVRGTGRRTRLGGSPASPIPTIRHAAPEAKTRDDDQLRPDLDRSLLWAADRPGVELRASIASQLPALSGDGYTVAFLTGAGPRPLHLHRCRPRPLRDRMTPGLSRKQATTELTRDRVCNDPAASPPLSSVAMSPDGTDATWRSPRSAPVHAAGPPAPRRAARGSRHQRAVRRRPREPHDRDG